MWRTFGTGWKDAVVAIRYKQVYLRNTLFFLEKKTEVKLD